MAQPAVKQTQSKICTFMLESFKSVLKYTQNLKKKTHLPRLMNEVLSSVPVHHPERSNPKNAALSSAVQLQTCRSL